MSTINLAVKMSDVNALLEASNMLKKVAYPMGSTEAVCDLKSEIETDAPALATKAAPVIAEKPIEVDTAPSYHQPDKRVPHDERIHSSNPTKLSTLQSFYMSIFYYDVPCTAEGLHTC